MSVNESITEKSVNDNYRVQLFDGTFYTIPPNALRIRKPAGIIAFHSPFKHLPRTSFAVSRPGGCILGTKGKSWNRQPQASPMRALTGWKAAWTVSSTPLLSHSSNMMIPLAFCNKSKLLPLPRSDMGRSHLNGPPQTGMKWAGWQMQVRQPGNLVRIETNQMLPSGMKINSPNVLCLLPHLCPCFQQAEPTVGAFDVQPVASWSPLS